MSRTAGSERLELRHIEVTLMCRNIRTLFNFEPPVTDEEIRAAALQFVRKVSGFNKPSKANEAAFLAAADEVAAVSRSLLRSLETNAPPPEKHTLDISCSVQFDSRDTYGKSTVEITLEQGKEYLLDAKAKVEYNTWGMVRSCEPFIVMK